MEQGSVPQLLPQPFPAEKSASSGQISYEPVLCWVAQPLRLPFLFFLWFLTSSHIWFWWVLQLISWCVCSTALAKRPAGSHAKWPCRGEGVKMSYFGLLMNWQYLQLTSPTVFGFLVTKKVHLGKDNVRPISVELCFFFFICIFLHQGRDSSRILQRESIAPYYMQGLRRRQKPLEVRFRARGSSSPADTDIWNSSGLRRACISQPAKDKRNKTFAKSQTFKSPSLTFLCNSYSWPSVVNKQPRGVTRLKTALSGDGWSSISESVSLGTKPDFKRKISELTQQQAHHAGGTPY